jgi:hypothetical protein
MVYKDIVRHNSETIVNFEPKSNCQYMYHLSSYVLNWQNNFQHGVEVFLKTPWMIRWNDYLTNIALIV